MGRTSIEWAQFTVNPLRARDRATGKVGHWCEKVSAGCTNCYSSAMQEFRFHGHAFDVRNRSAVEPCLEPTALHEVLRRRIPTRWFWCDMTDLFGDWVRDEWLDQVFATMAITPHHTHLVLTKRPVRMRAYVGAAPDVIAGRLDRAARGFGYALHPEGVPLLSWPLPNVWLGVSVEDQRRADERIPALLRTPAAVRFVSCEPLLGPLELSHWLDEEGSDPEGPDENGLPIPMPGIDWVIVGGESGPGARPCHVAWIRSIVQQCRAASVPVFVKQLGAYVVDRNDAGFDGCEPTSWPDMDPFAIEHDIHGYREEYQGADVRVRLRHRKGGDPAEWPADLRVREFPK